MLSIARRAFNFEPEPGIFLPVSGNRKLKISRLSFETDLSIGLRLILDHISHADSSPNPNNTVGLVIKKPANTFNFIADPISSIPGPTPPIRSELESGDFLKSCKLCKKRLSSNDDIYMYMGDQGFCSVECRSEQISKDETKELEKAPNRRVQARAPLPSAAGADPPKCPDGGNCETCRLLEDLRKRRRRRKPAKR